LLALALGALFGCGGISPSSFSGGGVPIGGSRLFGRVVAANNTAINLSNVAVSVQATPDGGVQTTTQMTTAQDGTFSFSNVLPGFSNGTVAVTATPADPSYQAQQVTLSVANGHTEQMIISLAPASFDISTAASISLALASPAVPGGGSVQVQAVVRDAAGRPLPIVPTLVFDGNFGMLAPDGTFSVPAGTQSGMGTISAYWYTLLPQMQQIHVDNNAAQQPPNPPILPIN